MLALRLHTFQMVSTPSCRLFHAAPRCIPAILVRMASARCCVASTSGVGSGARASTVHQVWEVQEGGEGIQGGCR